MKQLKLTFLLTILMSMVGARAFAYDAIIDGICYDFSGTNAIVTYHSYDGYEKTIWRRFSSRYVGDVVIPESVNYNGMTYCVTTIGNGAFCNSDGRGSGLRSVTIPNSVTQIGEYAFFNCSGLTSITIGNSVTSIGDNAFNGCSGLNKVIISDIAAWCKISFGDNPLYYAHHLYSNEDTEITDLVIPNNVTSIGGSAFGGCSGLASVTIPNSVTSISDYVFDGCTSLTSVNIPNSVTSIGSSAFRGCSGLTSVMIGNSVTSISDYVFDGCTSLTSVTIPNSVTSIGSSAFSRCTGLTSMTIPNSVTSIGSSAFWECSGLTSMTIPNSVTSIGSSVFWRCI